MDKDEIRRGLQALGDEIATARTALARGDDELGLSNVGPRIEELCSAAVALPAAEVAELQPLMTQVRDELQELSDALGEAISRADAGDGTEPDDGTPGGGATG